MQYTVVNRRLNTVFRWEGITACNALIEAFLQQECMTNLLEIDDDEHVRLIEQVEYDCNSDLVKLGDYYTLFTGDDSENSS